jgi:hypothetical protein
MHPPQTPARPTASPRAQGTAVRRSGTQPKLVSTQSEPAGHGHALPDARGSGGPHGNGQGQDGGTALFMHLCILFALTSPASCTLAALFEGKTDQIHGAAPRLASSCRGRGRGRAAGAQPGVDHPAGRVARAAAADVAPVAAHAARGHADAAAGPAVHHRRPGGDRPRKAQGIDR